MSREIDLKIAEHLFGYDMIDWEDTNRISAIPHYSTDSASAWLVVEKMETFHQPSRSSYFIVNRSDSGWRVSFWRCRYTGNPNYEYFHGKVLAPTVSMAICKAALTALGVEYESN